MDEHLRPFVIAALGLAGAHATILRQLLRHLVEEALIPPDKAARIVLGAANTDLPASGSSGETYDAAREELVLLAEALQGWPGNGREPQSRGPRHDR